MSSGQGTILKAESISPKDIPAQEQVFDYQSIHGIKVQDAWQDQSGIESLALLIWGGRRLALGRITFLHRGSDGNSCAFSLAVGPDVEAADWILDATFAVSAGPPMVAYFVTAHNDVFVLRSNSLRDLNINLDRVASGLNSILYSAHLKPLSTKTILVASGTVFGEVIVWSCYSTTAGEDCEVKWNSRTYKVFHGHHGSIFGVSLSNIIEGPDGYNPKRLLASCSDDRTIRVWDVSEVDSHPEVARDATGHLYNKVQQTGFGHIADASIASTWGHLSRIWGVEFIYPDSTGSSASLPQLISRGEDATCQGWNMVWELPPELPGGTTKKTQDLCITHASSDHRHFGKHIWSYTRCRTISGSVDFTGGSDGAIIGRSVVLNEANSPYLSVQTPLRDVVDTTERDLTRDCSVSLSSNDSIKHYIFLSGHVVLATTSSGHMIKGTVQEPKEGQPQSLGICWTRLFNAAEFGEIAVMTSEIGQGVVHFATTAGDIWMYKHTLQSIQLLAKIDQKISNIFAGTSSPSSGNSTSCHLLLCSNISSTAKLLQITQLSREPKSPPVSKAFELHLPPTFQPTAFLEVTHLSCLVLGSRSGALAIYLDILHQGEMVERISPAICIRHIHGSESVTGLQHLPAMDGSEKAASQFEVLSTGRDGTYAIHRITFQKGEEGSIPPVLTTLHRSCPPFGPNIEGASIIAPTSGGTELLLHGFDGKNFVVWNESTNSEIMKVPCGGAHRSWAYFANCQKTHQGTPCQGGCFIWTKAGVINMARPKSPTHKIIQPGGHGREIKAMALHGETLSSSVSNGPIKRLIATGAEDTIVRLWLVTVSGWHTDIDKQSLDSADNATCIRILKKHTTGIQHLTFCKDLLFSSAGCEELFIWKVIFGVRVAGIGTVFQASLPKHAKASDLRIISFEVIPDPSSPQAESISKAQSFLMYIAYSNSMTRVFKYTNDYELSAEGRFWLLGGGFYNTNCLTDICRVRGRYPWFLTASTNGAVALWPDVDHRVDNTDAPDKMIHRADHYIHQNAILALDTIRLAAEYHLLLTGGDDNAFGVTLVLESALDSKLYEDRNSAPCPKFRTLLISAAHAAAITALEILDSTVTTDLAILTVASTGNDQRLKIWRITVNLDVLPKYGLKGQMSEDMFGPEVLDAISVQLVKETWTSVADVSSMLLIPGVGDTDTAAGEPGDGTGGRRLMVAGIGMEMMRVDSGE